MKVLVAQSVERTAVNRGVVGSSPTQDVGFVRVYSLMVELWFCNPKVRGSSPCIPCI